MSSRSGGRRLRTVGIAAVAVTAAIGLGFGANSAMADSSGQPTAAEAQGSTLANAELLDSKCGVPADRDLNVTTKLYQVASGRQVSDKVMLAMFETGWVESHMNNLDCGDSDSVGVFQQRPSMGWCDPASLCRDVEHATNKFLDQAIPNDAKNPGYTAGQLAQSVQRSAYPDRYDAAQSKANEMLAEASGAPLPDPVWPKLLKGSAGSDVVAAQYLLTAQGYAATADGDFGPATESATTKFQAAKGLEADGVIGEKTWGALIVSLANGDKGDAVKALQSQLNAHGSSLTVDGDFGPATETALKGFQDRAKVDVDGKATTATWLALIGT